MNNKRAANIYRKEINEIAALLDDLKSYIVDDHMGVSLEEINYGDVSSVQYLKKLLKEAAAFAGLY